MIARMCDRCGKYYGMYGHQRKDIKNVNGFALLNIELEGSYWMHNTIDLCPECMNELKAWLDKKGLIGGADNG